MRIEKGKVSARAWLDGKVLQCELASPSVASSTFQMGSGVFDGLMAYRNRGRWHLHLGRQHLERFCAGCRRMGLGHRWSATALEEGAIELLASCPETTHYLRPIAYRPQPEILLTPSRELPVSVCIFGVVAGRDEDDSLSAQVSAVTRVSSDAIPVSWKVCGAYANSFLAQTRAEEAGFDTAIFLDRLGRVSEASVANLFLSDGETLLTPALDADVFPGLTRTLLLDLARQLGIPCAVGEIWPTELGNFSAAFVCSTLGELKPLGEIDDRRLATARDPLFRRLLDGFRDLTHERAPYPSVQT